jgi:hypothetical protein
MVTIPLRAGGRAATLAGLADVAAVPAKALESAAAARVVETLSPKTGMNKRRFSSMVRQQAPALLKRGEANSLTASGAFREIGDNYEKASAAWEKAEAALDPKKVYTDTPKVVTALKQEIDELTSKAVPGSGGWDTVPEYNTTQVESLKRAARDIGNLGTTNSYEALRNFRQSYDRAAKVVWTPSTSTDFLADNARASAAAKVAGHIRDLQAKSEPGMAAANAEYHIYASMLEVGRAVVETEATRPSVFRRVIPKVVGMFEGFRQGGITGAAVGLGAGVALESAISAGITTKLKTARLYSDLATAIRGGKSPAIERSFFNLTKAGVKFGAVGAILNQADRERMDERLAQEATRVAAGTTAFTPR